MRVCSLGRLAIEGATIRQPKPLLVLAFLALEPPQDRRFLAELFWPHAKNPQGSLRVCLLHLRQAAPGAVQWDGSRLASAVETDADAFEAAVRRGDDTAALALYGGPFVAGVSLDAGNVELEEWVVSRRELYAEMAQTSLLHRAEAALGAGLVRRAATFADAAFRLPEAPGLDELGLSRLYAILLACQSPLWLQVRSRAMALGLPLPPPRSLVDRPRRASDMVAPFRPAMPASSVLCNGGVVELLEFRVEELRQLVGQLCAPGSGVVSVSGPAGSGTSRLVLEACRDPDVIRAFDGATAYVDVSCVSGAAALAAQTARACGYGQYGVRTAAGLSALLGNRRALLVLDGVNGGWKDAAKLLAGIACACPNVKIVAVSRVPLPLSTSVLIPLTEAVTTP